MNHKYLYLLLLFLIVSCQRNVETEPPVLKEMCQRLFSRHAQSFLFELLTDSIDTDRFILESSQGKIRIKGNNRNSLAAGLNVTIVFFSTIVHSAIPCPIGNGRTGND